MTDGLGVVCQEQLAISTSGVYRPAQAGSIRADAVVLSLLALQPRGGTTGSVHQFVDDRVMGQFGIGFHAELFKQSRAGGADRPVASESSAAISPTVRPAQSAASLGIHDRRERRAVASDDRAPGRSQDAQPIHR